MKIDSTIQNWAGNIKLNGVLDSLSEIAAASKPKPPATEVEVGNGKIAELISRLRNGALFIDGKATEILIDSDLNITFQGKTTPDNFYRDIINDLGISGREAISMKDSHDMVMAQIDHRRKEISGVSLDEDMTEMIKFQHAYNANARFINSIDAMIDQIVNRMGLVGR